MFVYLFPLVSFSQQGFPAGKLPFHPVVQAGLVNGSNGISADVQAIAGFAFKPITVGLGAGIDYYRLRTVPLFASLKKDIGRVRKPAFIYGDVGYNLDWLTDKNRTEIMYNNTAKYSGGLYYDVGIGGRFSKKSLTGLILSAGYSRKVMKQNVDQTVCPFVGPCLANKEVFKYELGRIILRLGWIF